MNAFSNPRPSALNSESLQRCVHFGLCGGCSTQDIPYATEIARKESRLRELLHADVRVTPSSQEYHYRTRMDFAYTPDGLGMRARGQRQSLIDLNECLLLTPRALDAFLQVKRALADHHVPPYSSDRFEGYLRYVTVRQAPVTDELMLVFLTSTDEALIEPVLLLASSLADSVVWTVTNRRADVSFGEVHSWRGRPWIEEQMGSQRLRFGANSFFQSNPALAAQMYDHVASRCAGHTTDLYCGVGGIALSASSTVQELIGLDNNHEAIRYAEENARRNGIGNARFYTGDARLFMDTHRCDTLILDPPRSGLGPKIIRKVLRAAPSRIVYVSCNPTLLAQELHLFSGYAVEDLRGFDLFPRTPHVEVVATFRRITS